MTPIRHRSCGAVVALYIGTMKEDRMRSIDIMYLDGTMPAPMSGIPACHHCGKGMNGLSMKRCFDEDYTPDFDVENSLNNPVRVSKEPGRPAPSMVILLARQRNIGLLVSAIIAVMSLVSLIAVLLK